MQYVSDEVAARSVYRHSGPPTLTLFTMINNDSGAGAHSALMINGSQRVIFDPAGTVSHPQIPERHDVILGASPHLVDAYTRAHARSTYHVVLQEVEVAPEVAELALQKAFANGPANSGTCTLTTSGLLASLPGMQNIRQTWFPKALMKDFGALPEVKTRELFEYDDPDKAVALRAYEPEAVAASRARKAAMKVAAE
ncbi:hypothetical protein DI396_06800 [Litorivita pollutaquae]|uniref:Uncharacterized protein n=1 Tax=Litorivita pollutaquae TaxID=2200892 RepID=A0A2V4MN11_9RHOB|nr:hypothetical protein DI396_06800 [Litorivita pollutaquae]